MKVRGPDRRKKVVPWKRPRTTDLRTGERVYTERRKGERRFLSGAYQAAISASSRDSHRR